jgi:hypothetical protein
MRLEQDPEIDQFRAEVRGFIEARRPAVHTKGKAGVRAPDPDDIEALQVHGGIGFTWEHDLHLYHRRAKANQVLFGDPHLHHERLAAALETATA